MIEGVFHFNVNCTDLDRTLPFYEMLGFKVILDFRDGMSSPQLAEGLALPKAQIRGVHLQIPNDPTGMRIDLLQFQDPKADGKPYPHLYHTGVARVALKTQNLQATYE
ncbi:MAG: VOC family protein, partial [Armatimonadota bacterium]|nr:VOC family protein [Armatimonadota bacterium]